jgi:tetratricopeptide (TPR) repeat protein
LNKVKILKSAEKYVLQGKIPAAIFEYQKILELDPNDLPILNTIGDLYVRLGNTTEGLKYFNQLANAYFDGGYKVKAIAIYKKISKLAPKAESARQRLAELYAVQGLLSEAREQYLHLAEIYLADLKPDLAVETFHKILSSDQSNVTVLKRLVNVELARGNASAATDLLMDAAERLRQRREFSEAKAMLKIAQEIGLDLPAVRLRFAKILFAEGQAESAVAMLLEMDPEQSSAEVQLALWECLLGARRLDEAYQVALRLFELDSTHFSLLLSLSDRYLELADFDHALEVLEPLMNAPSIEPFGARLSDMLQKILSEEPDHLPTIECSVKVNRKLGQGHLVSVSLEHLASYHIKHENYQAALRVYGELLKIDPANTIVREGMERLKKQLGEGTTSEPTAPVEEEARIPSHEGREVSEPLSPQEFALQEGIRTAAPPHVVMDVWQTEAECGQIANKMMLEGEVLVSYGLLHRAAQTFEDLLLLDPQHTVALRRMVEIYSALDRLADAAICCVKLSKVAVKQGQLEDARQWTQRATEFDRTVQSKAVEVESPRPSNVTALELQKLEEGEAIEGGESLYDLSNELEEISRGMESEKAAPADFAATPHEATAAESAGSLDESLQEIDFYMEQGFWAEARAVILNAMQTFPQSEFFASRLKRCDAMMSPLVQPAVSTTASVSEAAEIAVAEPIVPPVRPEGLMEILVPTPGVEEAGGELDDLLSEFDLGGSAVDAGSDFSTHYNLGIAFREMGLLEEAIAEVQKAISILDPEVQKQEYVSVCSLLGTCLVESSNFPEAVGWFEHGVAVLGESETSEEALSLRFDLANACELAGDSDRALKLFQKIYGDNPNFRDVKRRVQAFERRDDSD